MKYWCEIRTQGVNDAMSRATGQINQVHRGIFEGAGLFEFFRTFAKLNPTRPNGQDIGAPPAALISGPHGDFKLQAMGGYLTFEHSTERLSALTATIVVAGLITPATSAIAA